MPHRNNFLLRNLAPATLARIAPHLAVVELQQAELLADTDQRVQNVYFPHTGVISNVVELASGDAIETGMIGNDGAFGANQALDDRLSLNRVVMQIGGSASMMGSDRVCDFAAQLPDFRELLVKYEQFFLSQVQQTAACNAVHDVQARTCKWLLRMHDLAGVDLPLTQEFLAQMIGVRRSSVTDVAGELQKAGMISYSRGRIHIENIERIRASACECDAEDRSRYRRIFQCDDPTGVVLRA